jgi:hypothetical protein
VQILIVILGLATIRAIRERFHEVISFLFIKSIFSFVLIQKKQKIKPEYLYPKKSSNGFISLDSYFYWCSMNLISFGFSYRDPAARVSHSTPGSLPTATAQILIVIFRDINIKAKKRRFS